MYRFIDDGCVTQEDKLGAKRASTNVNIENIKGKRKLVSCRDINVHLGTIMFEVYITLEVVNPYFLIGDYLVSRCYNF
jgi:hypothetical protein